MVDGEADEADRGVQPWNDITLLHQKLSAATAKRESVTKAHNRLKVIQWYFE
jgi:hypothetical protein